MPVQHFSPHAIAFELFLVWLNGYLLAIFITGVGIALHECGHVVGCLLASRPIKAVLIGTGSMLMRFYVAQIPVTIRCSPFSDAVLYSYEKMQRPITVQAARRFLATHLLITAGAPIGTALILFVILKLGDLGLRSDVVVLSFLVQVMTLIWNLFPRDLPMKIGGRKVLVPNDGKKMLGCLKMLLTVTRRIEAQRA